MIKGRAGILLAAPRSGSGKTMITCGVIGALKRRGLNIAAFKCGPDYIDPMFHRSVLGIASGNLDTFFTDGPTTCYLYDRRAGEADVTVVEGVMGYYDGLGGSSELASTYDVAKTVGLPTVLVVDAKGASVTLAAVIRGMMEYRHDSNIRGVILNRVSAGYYDRLREVIERECGVAVLGYMPASEELSVPSRHLGLIAPGEMDALLGWTERVTDAVEAHVDLDALLAIAEGVSELSRETLRADFDVSDKASAGREAEAFSVMKLEASVRIAVARDEAFSFYYAENIELLERMGAVPLYFSPLHDRGLPEDIGGILLGGGYPERYAAELSANEDMRRAVREACGRGMPCLAECGGFLYLQRELEGTDGGIYEMAGVLSGRGFRTDRLCRFGYMEASAQSDGLLGTCRLRGHEFHYWDCTENGADFISEKPHTGTKSISHPCMVHTETMAAGFPHFYYYSNQEALYRYLLACLSYRKKERTARDDV